MSDEVHVREQFFGDLITLFRDLITFVVDQFFKLLHCVGIDFGDKFFAFMANPINASLKCCKYSKFVKHPK
jgi:hypothetical protein